MSGRKPSLAEPVIAAEFWRNRRGESVRVTLSEYEGRVLADVRVHYTDKAGVLRPTQKGLAVSILRLPDLAKALSKAERRAIELGLLEGGDT